MGDNTFYMKLSESDEVEALAYGWALKDDNILLTEHDKELLKVLLVRGYKYVTIFENIANVSMNEPNVVALCTSSKPLAYKLVNDNAFQLPLNMFSDNLLYYIKYINRNIKPTIPYIISLGE